jgi:hypothetical protein
MEPSTPPIPDPTSPDSPGGAGGTRRCGRASLADLKLLRRALRAGWKIPDEAKDVAPKRMLLILEKGKSARSWIAALRAKPEGMTRTEIRRMVFKDNKTSGEVARVLGLLERYRVARVESVQTGGRPAERWFATNTKPTST